MEQRRVAAWCITYLTNVYDANKRVIQQTLADGAIWQYAYTLSGSNVVQTVVTDPRGNTTTYGISPAGFITSITNALGQTTTITREAGTNVITQVVDPLGRTTTLGYDANKNLTNLTQYLDPPANTQPVTRTFTYETVYNQGTSATDPLSHTTTFGRDALANLTSITDPLTHTTTITRNSFGQPTALTDALNNQTTLAYDAMGNLATVTDPLGNVSTRAYDLLARLTSQTDPRGFLSQFTYDLLNRVTAVANPLGEAVQFQYDPNGNLTKVTDPRKNAISYTYDNMDRVSVRADQLNKQETYTYDLAGNLTSAKDRKGHTTNFTYDALNRRTVTTYADASTVTSTYDAGGRLTSLADSVNGTISWTYDALDRVLTETTPQGTVTYAYDNAARRTTMTVAGQTPVSYSYDNADRAVTISKDTLVAAYAYDNADRRTSLTLPNGVSTQYSYDQASRLTGLIYTGPGGTLGNLTYTYDPAGNRTVTGGAWARTLLPAAITTASYDAANRQLTFGGKTMTFDANGNLLTLKEAGQTTTYTWDARDQLASIAGPTLTAAFIYNASRGRYSRTVNGETRTYQYDGMELILESVAGVEATYLAGFGVDAPLVRSSAGVTEQYLQGNLGSVVALTDGAGVTGTTYSYEPFGNGTAQGAATNNRFTFTGREDDRTGLYYYRARYYHPGLGRFISEDPVGLRGGTNFYAYVRNNPISYMDPLGLLLVHENDTYGRLQGALDYLRAFSPTARAMIRTLERAEETYYIRAQPGFPPAGGYTGTWQEYWYNPLAWRGLIQFGERRIVIDPNANPVLCTTAGPQPASTELILGHELGHAATGLGDWVAPSEPWKDNMRWIENQIRLDLGQPQRTQYWPPSPQRPCPSLSASAIGGRK